MEEKLEKMLSSLNSEKKYLFENADKQVIVGMEEAREEERRKLAEKEKKNNEILHHTELIAYHIASLVYNTLFDANREKAPIKKVNELLGKLSSGTNDTERSYYKIDENGLTLYLNYSNEYFTDRAGYGECFLDNDKQINYDYLINILESNGIYLKREKKETVSSVHSGLDLDIVTITYLRPEKLKQDGRNR